MGLKKALFPLILLGLCTGCPPGDPVDRDFRADMRQFVQRLAVHARKSQPQFLVVPQNGQELLTADGEADGPVSAAYVAAVDGQAREDLFYGYLNDNQATPAEDRAYLLAWMQRAEAEGVQALVADYCSTPAFEEDSYARNLAEGFVSFAAPRRDLDVIPAEAPREENAGDIDTLEQAKNMLYLLNPDGFDTKAAYLSALGATNYDLLIIDAFFNEEPLLEADVAALQIKANGGKRLVLSYMSIGEAEDYRYYWQSNWRPGNPSWIEAENPDWEGNYKVRYWDARWQAVIFGSEDAYLDRIVAAGFDGVYLDIIDAFEYFE